MSYLHSRRRLHPSSHSGPNLSPRLTNDNKGEKAKQKSDLKYALGIVGSFLLVGLGLGYLILQHKHRKVILHTMWSRGKLSVFRGSNHLHDGAPRFVTVIMPSIVKPDGRLLRLKSIADTWGPKSRAIYVVHNQTEFPDAGPIDSLSHEYPQLMIVPPEIGPDEGVPRLIHVIRTVSKQIDPDFAFFVNDHTFVIAEHVCSFLSELNPLDDMYLGHALKNGEDVFNSGAAGYILSRSTMSKLVKTWDEGDPKCVIQKNTNKWLQGNPGLLTATCLKHSLHISTEDTRKDGKYHRFHAFGLNRVVTGKVDQWYINKHQDLNRIAGFDKSYETILSGVDCCADDTISFHYVEHLETRVLYHVRQAVLDNPRISDSDLKAKMMKEWPVDVKDLGGYSRGLPSESNEKDWSELLSVLRKISTKNTKQVEC
jgi:hypothetical protein